jgi:hypothetical protein
MERVAKRFGHYQASDAARKDDTGGAARRPEYAAALEYVTKIRESHIQ